jgi:hypothetical protein
MPRPSAILRLVAFTVPAALCMAALQPLVAAATGVVNASWAASLTLPSLGGAGVAFVMGRAYDRGDSVQPPWYSAWALLPGAFLLAGAAAMCVLGALFELGAIREAMWALLVGGSLVWSTGIILVRRASR